MKTGFLASLLVLVATFYQRINHYDEACLAEQAYWLVHDGVVRSEFYRGLWGWEKQLFVFHKLFICFGAAWQRVLGHSLVAGKTIGAIWTLAGGLALYNHLRRQALPATYLWLGLWLFVGNAVAVEFAFVNRPEPMCATLGFLSFSLITRHRTGWAALLAGLAALTHLNGLCFIGAGVGWLWWQGNRRAALTFGLVAGLVSSLYLADVALTGQWERLARQWQHDPALYHLQTVEGKLRALVHIGTFLTRTGELVMLAMGVLLLTRTWPAIRRTNQSLDRYLICLMVAYGLIVRSHSAHYILLFLPIVCVWVVIQLARYERLPLVINQSLRWLLRLYFAIGMVRICGLLHTNLTTTPIAEVNARLATLINHPGGRVIAPIDFFYEQIQHFSIHSVDYFLLVDGFPHHRPSAVVARLFRAAEAEKAVAVITYAGTNDPATPSPRRVGYYRRVYQDKHNSLYIRH